MIWGKARIASSYIVYMMVIYVVLLPLYTFLFGIEGIFTFLLNTFWTIVSILFITLIFVLTINNRKVWVPDDVNNTQQNLQTVQTIRDSRLALQKLHLTIFITTITIATILIWGNQILISVFMFLKKSDRDTIILVTSNVVILSILIIIFNSYMRRKISKLERIKPWQADRMKSLYPLISQVILVLTIVYILFFALKLAGVQPLTLITSLGAIGVVLGIVAQKEIQGFFSALQFLTYGHIGVNDNIKIDNFSGVVEKVGARNVFLRDAEGLLYIIPFSSVTTVIHKNKDFSMATISVNIFARQDLQKVVELIKAAYEIVAKVDSIKVNILEDLQIYNYEFLDTSIQIKARVKTLPGKQFDVRTSVLEELHKLFLANDIEFSSNASTLHRTDK